MRSWFVSILLSLTTSRGFAEQTRFTGVNLAGAEFGESNLPGTYNQHYTYPTAAEVDYFLSKGMNIFRLPFRWERLQYTTNAPFNSTELSRIQTFVNHAASRGGYVLLDPHNYARYYHTNVVGSAALLFSTFADFWSRLATIFRNHPQVIFGLMNEPHDMATEVWRDAANAAIAAIRGTGATNLILVPGNAWTGAHSWEQSWYGTPNSRAMLSITDPINYYAFEVHQYLDSDSSGGSSTCVSTSIGVERLAAFTAWCRRYGVQGFLGEFAGSTNAICLQALRNMLTFINDNSEVWVGWTYWAAGPWWGNYMFSLEPLNGADRLQTDVLQGFIPIPRPLLSVRKSPARNDTAFGFPTRYGFTYQPQASFSLEPFSWTNFGNAITGNAQSANIFMRTSSNEHRFFRLETDRLP